MNHTTLATWMRGRAMAAVACSALALPLVGCGSGASNNSSGANLPPVDDTRGGSALPATRPAMAPQRQGMSTQKKVILLAGAAALYYLYRKHQASNKGDATAQNGQPIYYLSKNGRVYYRDQNAQAHWVTPPPQGIQVPYDEAQQYSQFQGYDNRQDGVTDLSRFASQGGM